MSKRFEDKLHEILNHVTLSSEDRQSYTADANEIRDYMMRKMKEKDKDFCRYFRGASLTGSYLDDLKIEKPDEFDVHIKLQLPYEVKISLDTSGPPGAIKLYHDKPMMRAMRVPHPITHISAGYVISRKKLQRWIREILESIFKNKSLNLQLGSGRIYQVEYSQFLRGYAVAHTIWAVDSVDRSRRISFDFVPAIEFTANEWISEVEYSLQSAPWFAVPYAKSRTTSFMICAPHLERELLKNNNNLKNSLRLLKAIRDNNEMPHLKSYLIKSVYLWENRRHNRCSHFWDQPMGDLTVYMTDCLEESLRAGFISFYWNNDLNLLNRLDGIEIRDYQRKLKNVLTTLKNCRNGSASTKELATLFGC